MESYICATCGVQHAPSERPPPECPVCEDERQWVPKEGQQWTTLAEMRQAGYENLIIDQEPGLTGIGTKPDFGIRQRALLLQTPQGNLLWECISLIDDRTIGEINARGGIDAITVSHPHFYDSMVEYSYAFGKVPIYLPAADRRWVMRPDPVIQFFDAPTLELFPGVTLICCGGHFEGSTTVHWAQGAEGRGVMMTSDTLQVCPDRKSVSFLYSYPNMIPLSMDTVRHVVDTALQYPFDRAYGIGWNLIIEKAAKAAIQRSADRYIRRVQGLEG